MTTRAALTPRARQEFRSLLRSIDADNPQAARRLRDLFDVALERIGTRPLIGRAVPALARPQYRFWSIPAFSLLLIYDANAGPARVLRVVHTARDLPNVLKELSS